LIAPLVLAGALVAFAAISACGGDSPTSPSSAPSLPVVAETEHYVFHAAQGDAVDTAWQERYHAWATAALGVSPRRITYNKYQNRAHMQQVVGIGNTNAYADRTAFAIHTIWPTDNHEVVHLFTSTWGDPVALINEGMAVAYQIDPARDLTPRWSGTPLHTLARQFRQDGRFVSLSRVVETAAWRGQDPNVMYPQSGSFVRWLIDTYGLERLRALYGRAAGAGESALGVRASFTAVYGLTIDEAEAAWLAMIAAA
jgi:hypothetical protein